MGIGGDRTTLGPGIHKISEAEYDGLSKLARFSHLKEGRKSALAIRAAILYPRDPTPAMNLGRGIHCAVFEPLRFHEEWVITPQAEDGGPLPKRSKAQQEIWKDWEIAHKGKDRLTAAEHEKCLAIQTVVRAHPVAKQLLQSGKPELTLLWEDQDTGVACKSRMDWLTRFQRYATICDLKSTTNASREAMARSIFNYSYHVQAAMYVDGMNTALQPDNYRFLIIAVEKEVPYDLAVYEIDSEAMQQGHREYKQYLEMFRQGTEEDIWPGYPPVVSQISLPAWARSYDDSIEE